MGYSCTDFTDDILEALNINVPDEDNDSPACQANLALAKIEQMQQALSRCYDDAHLDPAAKVLVAKALE